MGHRTRSWNPRIAGFTLIELLVVVGIIAVLMAILLPALGRARQEVMKVTCASNLRQWGTAVNSYATENNNRFAHNPGPGGEMWDNGPTVPEWAYILTHIYSHRFARFIEGNLEEYNAAVAQSGDNVTTHCPTDEWARRGRDDFFNIGYFFMPFSDNVPNAVDWMGTRGWVSRRALDGPYSEAPFMSDTHLRVNDEVWLNEDLPMASHMGSARTDRPMGGNFLFEDGSVHWHNDSEIDIGQSHSGHGRDHYYKVPVPGLLSD